jgi:hypothetical protein
LLNNIDYEKNITTIGDTEGLKQLKIELEETVTVAHTLYKCIYDFTRNEVIEVKYIDNNTSRIITFTIKDKNPAKLFIDSVNYAVSIYEQLLFCMSK